LPGELVWDDDIQRYKGVPEFMPPPPFDVDAWLAGLTEEQKAQLGLSYMRNHLPVDQHWLPAVGWPPEET
jgi:hypothetical protein